MGILDPNQLNIDFDGIDINVEQQKYALDAAREIAEKEILSKIESKPEKPTKRNRIILENLPVIEVIIEPKDIDHARYIRIGEEHTRTLEFEPGKLYVKDIIRPKYGLRSSVEIPQEN